MKRMLWQGGLAILILIFVASGIVWRLHRHPTTLRVTLYCQGVIVFPLAAHKPDGSAVTVGSTMPCEFVNQVYSSTSDPYMKTVAFSVYGQSCIVAPTTLIIPVMRPYPVSCDVPGSSQFTDADDAAIASELLGRCMYDAAFIDHVGEPDHNAPCRLFIVGVSWE